MVFEELSRAPAVLAFSIRLTGHFSTGALADALAALVREHDVLRTAFKGSGEHRQLVVLSRAEAIIAYVDMCDLPGALVEQALAACSQELQGRLLDRLQPPLMRALVVRLEQDEHLVNLTVHHGLVDEPSMRLLIERLAAGYSAARQGLPIPRHSAPPFHQVAATLDSSLNAERRTRSLQFWQRWLEGCPAEFAPPRDREPSGQRAMRASHVQRRFRAGMSVTLDRQAAKWGATRFGVVAASLALLLARLSNSRDVVFAVSVSLRHIAGASRVVGPLMSSVILRVDLTGAHTLNEATFRTMDAIGRALAHSDTPLDVIYSAIRPEATSSSPPFAQVLLSQHGRYEAPIEMLSLETRSLETPTRFSPYHLAFTIGADGADLVAACDFLDALYDEETVGCHLKTWEELLATGESLETETSVTMSSSGAATPCQDTLLDRLAAQLVELPDSIALVDSVSGQHVTRRHLDCISEEVARGLLAKQIGVGKVIGIQLARGPALWAAVLGVLKAGHVCAPLRAQDSRPMLMEQIQSGGIEFVIIDRECWHSNPEDSLPATFWSMPQLRKLGREHRWELSRLRRQSAAIVLSTSGSTGQSKWVELPLAALDATLAAFDRSDLLRGRARMLSITDISFDISWLEVFGTLYCGGMAVIAAEGIGGDGAALARSMHKHEPDTFQATPFTWTQLMSIGWLGTPGLRGLCGGECAPLGLASWLARLPIDAINVYGPTETNIWSMAGRFIGRQGGDALGEPLSGEYVHLLSDEFEPTPPGGIGGLFIGGAGLAHGYRGDPVKTASVFVPDRLASTPGSRLYKTGDVARRHANGALVFRGRTDGQVKLRGFRVELDGVAQRLSNHPAVDACVVCCRDDPVRGPVLVAYMQFGALAVVPEHSLLHQFARECLPAHCVPSAFVPVPSFPVNSTNKIDHRKLPAPEERDFSTNDATLAPRTPTEEGVAMLWVDALGHGGFGVDDNFFALGGTSLRALEVTSRVIACMSAGFTFAQFLDMPTISGMARLIDAGGAVGASMPPIRSGPPLRRVSLSEIYRRQVMRQVRANTQEDVNVRQTVTLKGVFRPAAFEHAIRSVSARHAALRAWLGVDEDGAFMRASASECVAPDFRVVDLSQIDRAAVARIVERFVQRPFDLRQAPLFRFGLFRIESDLTVLALAASHLVVDGWSLQVLAREIGLHYRNCDRPIIQHQASVQFTDYVAWQEEWFRSPPFAEGLRFWMRRVLNPPPALFGQIEGGLGQVRSRQIHLGPRRALALSTVAKRLGCTPFSCALGCTFHAMRTVSGITELAALTAAANRADPSISGMVGLVMNPVVVRISAGTLSLQEIIGMVWREVCAVNQHQGIPIDVVYDALESVGKRPTGEPAQLHVLWNERGLSEMQLPGTTHTAFPQGDAAAPHELSSAPSLQLWFVHGAKELDMTFSYRVDKIADDQADLLVNALTHVLDQLES